MKRFWIPGIAAVALLGVISPPAVAQPSPTASNPSVMLVVDTSGSMAGSRLQQAKAALSTSVDALAAGQAAGLRSYAGSCGDRGILRVPLGGNNRDQLRSEISALVAGGGTPTPDALVGAAGDLSGVTGQRAIILISDGESTCGDPCPTATRLKNEQGIDFTVHTVGFQAPDAAESELACIARETGGKYFSVDDQQGLTGAIGQLIGGGSTGHEYVAVGDSTTTGFSVQACSGNEDRAVSPYGCIGTPPGTPFPQHVAADGGSTVDDLQRVGIWGYKISDAVKAAAAGKNADGPWEPQLIAASKATKLVTVNLGINDMEFSDVGYWLGQCVGVEQKKILGRTYRVDPAVKPSCRDVARARAGEADLQKDLDTMFNRLDAAKARGAQVVITLYYNPYNKSKQLRFAPDRSCKVLNKVAQHIIDALNTELSERATAHRFPVADLGPAFEGHGAGSSDRYVYGTECEQLGALSGVDFDLGWPPVNPEQTKKNIQILYDPHPNSKGTRAQANTVLGVIQ